MVGIGTTVVELRRDEIEELISSLMDRLRKVRRERKRVEGRLKSFETRYGISTLQLVELIEKASNRQGTWPLPDDADMDVIEWEAYARVWMELVEEEKKINELLSKLRGAK